MYIHQFIIQASFVKDDGTLFIIFNFIFSRFCPIAFDFTHIYTYAGCDFSENDIGQVLLAIVTQDAVLCALYQNLKIQR